VTFVFGPKMDVRFRFRFVSSVNGISFSSAFSFTAENEINAFRSVSSIHHKKGLVLVLNTRLGLERILKSWSWSWN